MQTEHLLHSMSGLKSGLAATAANAHNNAALHSSVATHLVDYLLL